MIIKIKHFFAYFENFFKPCAFYFGLLSVLIFKPKYIIIISMKFLTKTVTIDNAEIVDENRMNHYEPKAERFGSILKHVFDLSVGEIVPVLYNADNPADIIVDYEQNFKK